MTVSTIYYYHQLSLSPRDAAAAAATAEALPAPSSCAAAADGVGSTTRGGRRSRSSGSAAPLGTQPMGHAYHAVHRCHTAPPSAEARAPALPLLPPPLAITSVGSLLSLSAAKRSAATRPSRTTSEGACSAVEDASLLADTAAAASRCSRALEPGESSAQTSHTDQSEEHGVAVRRALASQPMWPRTSKLASARAASAAPPSAACASNGVASPTP